MWVCISHLDSLLLFLCFYVCFMFLSANRGIPNPSHTQILRCQLRHSPPEVAPVGSPFPLPETFSMMFIFEASEAVTSYCWFVQKLWGVIGVGALTYVNTPKRMIIYVLFSYKSPDASPQNHYNSLRPRI